MTAPPTIFPKDRPTPLDGLPEPMELQCLSPIRSFAKLRGSQETGLWQNLRCGYCKNCRQHKQASWIVRLWAESLQSTFETFITLTFRDDKLPQTLTLDPLQRYLKRLRHHFPGKIRYLCCGEYGPKTNRPHYHGILFFTGCQPTQKDFAEVWGNGFVSISPMKQRLSSYRYVTKYCWKRLDERPPVVMSRKPGIGYATFFELGRRLAIQGGKDMPRYCQVHNSKFPLSETVREYISAGYYSETGGILQSGRSPITTDLVLRWKLHAGLVDIRGAPVSVNLYG